MTDRELLEMAAKAAGHTNFEWDFDAAFPRVYDPRGFMVGWNPLADDGDALRLAVKLFLFVDSAAGAPDSFGAELVRAGNEVVDKTEPRTHDDPYAAARRAIVRAAAEIGRGIAQPMPSADLPEDNYYKTQAEAEEAGKAAAEIGKAMP